MSAPTDRLRVAVAGATGYVGGELLRLLADHPAVGELRGASTSAAGRRWSEIHPHFLNRPDDPVLEAFDPAALGAWADVVFLALPHGESQRVVDAVAEGRPQLVVDTAADFRFADLARAEATYGPHRRPELLGAFANGLADVEGEALRGADRIAVPGCFATAALLALWPLAPVLGPASHPVCWAATGSSGSGATAKPTTHHPTRAHNFFAYGLAGHRHEAELAERLAAWCGPGAPRCSLLTHSAPLVRGIHATLLVRPAEPVADPMELLRRAYRDRPFVHPLDRPPELAAVAGTNHAHLHAATRDGGREVVVLAVIDNLVKGAAGQAVQAMNLALGLAETAGLGHGGMTPC
ncbi:MAG: N-acetyl-gamma-glutamyl-phosphate reductase [Thermoanaerobaculales bacterium]|nr:N-acetyl-gamma-glutamyl-phosphate reductase [Thermoanaerobaculales bacterium]